MCNCLVLGSPGHREGGHRAGLDCPGGGAQAAWLWQDPFKKAKQELQEPLGPRVSALDLSCEGDGRHAVPLQGTRMCGHAWRWGPHCGLPSPTAGLDEDAAFLGQAGPGHFHPPPCLSPPHQGLGVMVAPLPVPSPGTHPPAPGPGQGCSHPSPRPLSALGAT